MVKIDWNRVDKGVESEQERFITRSYGRPSLETTVFHDAPISAPWNVPGTLAVSVAITGAFFREKENPNQPLTVDAIRESAREVLRAGASTVHIHVRDDRGLQCLSLDRFKAVIEPLKREFPDVALDGCLVCGYDGEWAEMKEVLKTGLMDATPVNPTATMLSDSILVKPAPILMEKTRLVLEAGVIPEIAVYTDADVSNADRYLIRSGLIQTPALWLVLPALPGCSPMENPRQMVESLMRMVNAIRDVDQDGTIFVCAAGRAAMALATFAASIGLHIRIGMEDTYYLWPHREDKIESNLQCLELAKQISTAVGRPIASQQQYRELLLRHAHRAA